MIQYSRIISKEIFSKFNIHKKLYIFKISIKNNKFINFFLIELVLDDSFLDGLIAEHFDVGLAEWVDPLAFAVFHRLRISTTIIQSAFGFTTMTAYWAGIPYPVYLPGFLSFFDFIIDLCLFIYF